jgi:hypothetical protein
MCCIDDEIVFLGNQDGWYFEDQAFFFLIPFAADFLKTGIGLQGIPIGKSS